MAWREECHQYMSEHPGRVVTKFQFSALFTRAWGRSMTMANVTAGFRVTGIYPLNRNVLSLDTSVAKLSQETGLFLPMHSPMCQSKKRVAFDFTDEEISLFERRFENGYDLTGDKRYNLWLSRYHPESSRNCHTIALQSAASLVTPHHQLGLKHLSQNLVEER